eukprot:3364827-Rhodomonas_salina.1
MAGLHLGYLGCTLSLSFRQREVAKLLRSGAPELRTPATRKEVAVPKAGQATPDMVDQSLETGGETLVVDATVFSDVQGSDSRRKRPRDLSFGMAEGLHISVVTAYLSSLRQHSDCEIVLILRNITDETN